MNASTTPERSIRIGVVLSVVYIAVSVIVALGATEGIDEWWNDRMIDAETAWLPPQIALDPRGYVITGPDARAAGSWPLERDPYLLETSVPGIFAAGDARHGSGKRVAAAVGEGSATVSMIHEYLQTV